MSDIIMYKADDVAEVLHIGIKKARELMSSPCFPAIKLGKLYRVEKKAFETWLENNQGKVVY